MPESKMYKARREFIEQLQADLKTTKIELNVLAMLAADNPKFLNPTGVIAAKKLRNRVLKAMGL